jgi:hypothetical protein
MNVNHRGRLRIGRLQRFAKARAADGRTPQMDRPRSLHLPRDGRPPRAGGVTWPTVQGGTSGIHERWNVRRTAHR